MLALRSLSGPAMPLRKAGLVAALLLLVASVPLVDALTHGANASTTNAALGTGSGVLDVDYASYLAKHDVVYNSPNTNPPWGLTVGNGRTGAMVWSQNGLTAQVSGVDLSEQSAYAAGLVNLATSPGDGLRVQHVPAAAVALRRDADHEVRQQPHRHHHGLAQLRGDGHPRR